MTRAIGILSLALAVGCSGEGDEHGPTDPECDARWRLTDVFTPPAPAADESPECLVVVASDHTSLLRGADRSACDANLGEPTRVRVRWPNSVSVFAYEGHDAVWSVEACE